MQIGPHKSQSVLNFFFNLGLYRIMLYNEIFNIRLFLYFHFVSFATHRMKRRAGIIEECSHQRPGTESTTNKESGTEVIKKMDQSYGVPHLSNISSSSSWVKSQLWNILENPTYSNTARVRNNNYLRKVSYSKSFRSEKKNRF